MNAKPELNGNQNINKQECTSEKRFFDLRAYIKKGYSDSNNKLAKGARQKLYPQPGSTVAVAAVARALFAAPFAATVPATTKGVVDTDMS